MQNNYYIGLDIGTDSVGYAVTNESYDLIKFKGERAWGAHLFEGANLCDERRGFRSARRRLDRKQQRVVLLQELFAKEIYKVDPQFFIRIKNSALCRDDADEPYCIFNDKEYTDADYHKQYPTIHHLIDTLMHSNEKFDVRLVYIALAWLLVHRGHFLMEISEDNISAITEFTTLYEAFINWFEQQDMQVPQFLKDQDALSEVLTEKASVSKKYELLKKRLNNGKRIQSDASDAVDVELLLKLLCGSKVSVKDIFKQEDYTDIGSFSLDMADEDLCVIMGKLTDLETELVVRAKAIYDWTLLVDILNGYDTISQAKVGVYQQHKNDLKWLKSFIKAYAGDKYNQMFRDETSTDNYVAYSKNNNAGEAFTKHVKKILEAITPSEKDRVQYDGALNRINSGRFLPKQVVSENRVIPYQMYLFELKEILKKAKNYLGFFNDADENGITVSEKIISIFKYRIPYFVGPLNSNASNAWLVRKEEGKIYPWNIESKVDFDASENEFIRRMTGKCTYLSAEDVLPKYSLCYCKYTVLNEINNIRVNGDKISVQEKQDIFEKLFMQKRKVTRKNIEAMLCVNKDDKITGIDTQINSSLSSYIDFKNLLNSGVLNENDVEAIILRITTTDNKGRFVKWLRSNYPTLDEYDVNYISARKYKDFGRLSARLLTQLEGKNNLTDEVSTIMQSLWETNNNLMELLSEDYTFLECIAEENKEYLSENPQTVSERLDSMYISNSVKRPIIRSLDIVADVVKMTGKPPKKIFVEMARGATEEQKNKRTEPRLNQILKLYEKCKTEDVAELKAQLEAMGDTANNRLQSKKLFLYYMQLGRCLYSGNAIELSELNSKRYDIDHIYPQSMVKDDSIHNNMVLVESQANGAKSDTYPISRSIQNNMKAFWKMLLDNGLITEEKYKRLIRTEPFSADEKWGFINRQMTETRQSTKAVAQLLKERYPETEIVYVKANLASEFRQEFNMFKSRTFNDLHHAKDAYLNIVVGNVYNSKFTKQWFYAYPEQRYNVKPGKLYTHSVVCGDNVVWDGEPMLEKVKKTLSCNHAHMTRYAFCRKGGLFDQQAVKGIVNGEAVKGLIPRKKNLPTEKYGGYNKPSVSYFMLVKYSCGKKSELMVMPVLLWNSQSMLENEQSAAEYARNRISDIINKPVDSVSFPLGLRKLKINTMFSFDGFRGCLAGNAARGKQLIISPYMPFTESNK